MNGEAKRAIATISTPNYWPYTAILLDSVRRVFPDWQVHVLALEEFPAGLVPAYANVLTARDVWGDLAGECRERFNLFEWACASKPRLLLYLLEHCGADLAVYADSDIEFFAQPECLRDMQRSIVLQPNVASLAESATREWERLHLQYGTFNGGFLAVRDTAEAKDFLQWWDDRVTRYCCTEPTLDVFSDQRWLDLVPGLFADVAIDRDPACNVAIWNFAGRGLKRTNDGYRVGDQPLAFFHYHRVRVGMDVAAYLAPTANDAGLSELVHAYLERAQRHADAAPAASARHDLLNGKPVPPLFYRAIRDTAAEVASPGPARQARQEARLRVLAYHSHHAARLVTPEPDIDRYQSSRLFRGWVDAWYFFMAPARAAIPVEWAARSAVLRKLRGVLARGARLVLGR